MSLDAALLTLDEGCRAAVLANVSALRALIGDSKRLHDELKGLGVLKIGLRQKVIMALTSSSYSEMLRAALRERDGLQLHADALCSQADRLVSLVETSPKELHEVIRSCGIKQMGLRQQVVLALRSLLPPSTTPSATPPAVQQAEQTSCVTLEANDNEETELQLECNGTVEAGSDGDDLALEDNEGSGKGGGEGSDDDNLLALEENVESEDEGFLVIERNDCVANELLELVEPPWLPSSGASAAFAKPAEGPVEGALIAGISGSIGLGRHLLTDELLTLKTSFAQGETFESDHYQAVLDLCAKLHLGFTARALNDIKYRGCIAALGHAVGTPRAPSALTFASNFSLEAMLEASESRPQRVCVLGTGSGAVPAIAAAQAGGTVVWAERIERFAELNRKLCERNGVGARVRVLSGAQSFEALPWDTVPKSLTPDAAPAVRGLSSRLGLDLSDGVAGGPDGDKFDAVITEDFSEDLLSDGIVQLASFARTSLLRRGGTFYPRSARVLGALASVRTTRTCGFDTRPFNVFRNSDRGEVVYDYEEVLLNEPGCAEMLSEPFELFSLNLNASTPAWAEPGARPDQTTLTASATASGIFNCVVSWYELDMGDTSGTLSFAPSIPPRHMYFRAVKQRLTFAGFEQRVAPGDSVRVELTKTGSTFAITAAADAAAQAAGRLVRWPLANVLSYHFPMIAEAPRNIRFERALLRAIRRFTRENGRAPHVLDIGSGTGLLAMMAARGGARKVTSVEMVPAVCAVASQIVQRNGYEHIVDVVNVRSDELSLYALGGAPANILVSELIDDHVIGDGVLPSISDARRRLLTPAALIVPRAARMFLQPVSLRCRGPPGISLDELNVMRTDQLVLTYPFYSGKLQRLPPSEYEALGPPLEIFDFPWATAEPGTLEKGRMTAPMTLSFNRGGVFNALQLLFTLQMDAAPGMETAEGETFDPECDTDYSSGLDNPETHWDNPIRFLPAELHVAQGDTLQLVATHNEHDLSHIALHGVTEGMLTPPGGIGHPELTDSTIAHKLSVSLNMRKLS